MKRGADSLRVYQPTTNEIVSIKRHDIVFVLDNILDTFNVGSMFRLADALAVKKVFLCGNMEFPPNSRIHKSAVGTELWTPWEKNDSISKVLSDLKKDGYLITGIEQHQNSLRLSDMKIELPMALVVGHETSGISADGLMLCDQIIELPMFGINKSFNVWGSAAVVGYTIVEKINKA